MFTTIEPNKKADDRISYLVNGKRELRMVVVDANTDGSGDASLEVMPKIRSSPANAEAIQNGTSVSGDFILTSPVTIKHDSRLQTTNGQTLASLTLAFTEDVTA